MHHTIDYSPLEGEEKKKKALKDVRQWLVTAHRFNQVARAAAKIDTEDGAHLALSFAGIQGYPATVLWEYAREKYKKK